MSLDRSTVEAVIQHYFDGVHEADADKLAAIFHPSADLRSLEKGELQVLHLPAWLNWTLVSVSEGPVAPSRFVPLNCHW